MIEEMQSPSFTESVVYIRDLLCCDSISIILSCNDPALCHPLLESASSGMGYNAESWLAIECVRATCDIVIQTGRIWWQRIRIGAEDSTPKDVVLILAPLIRPAGTLGVMLCIIHSQRSFGVSEYCLLDQQRAWLAERIEHILYNLRIARRLTSTTANPCTPPVASVESPLTLAGQDTLLSMVSHDLRLPLSVMKGYVGLLQSYGLAAIDIAPTEMMSAQCQQTYLTAIMEQVEHLEILIRDVLDISRAQVGQLLLHPAPIDIASLCQGVSQYMQSNMIQLQRGHCSLHYLLDSPLPPAWADEDRVRQILFNLIENAIKYSPDGGPIEILASTLPVSSPSWLPPAEHEQPGYISITIRDHGVGIASQQQYAVFQPFVRLQQPAVRDVAGTGLGLYISHVLVEAMHGSIVVQSGEGQGTSVTFTLPIAIPVPQQAATPLSNIVSTY
ncbi:sensor histidine kinase [Dictyobacter arantiisoli]|uniref:histidine kinase n=1 Tax=Dictyobacter arantiisoli TaxID=2014874 RepID=A0A5A5T8X0_9CHLR|nr:HAMP domain-containing sensor histidine kinase [Dictyobacter arantiisoli]GCF07787.1 hypothetical protein KDI_13510 [Dictyobacter arantiisoli]